MAPLSDLSREEHEYFILPTTQLPPFDVNKPWPTEINDVHFTNYIFWMKNLLLTSPLPAIPLLPCPEALRPNASPSASKS